MSVNFRLFLPLCKLANKQQLLLNNSWIYRNLVQRNTDKYTVCQQYKWTTTSFIISWTWILSYFLDKDSDSEAFNCNNGHISRPVQPSRPLTIRAALITAEEQRAEWEFSPSISPVQAHCHRDERKSFTNFPATQPCFPNAHERSCGAQRVQVRGSLWACVSQHFHKICKFGFLSQPFSKSVEQKSRNPVVSLFSYGPNKREYGKSPFSWVTPVVVTWWYHYNITLRGH